jgi:hypothetical protein
MKHLLFVCSLLLSTGLFAQKATAPVTYTGRIGISTIEFNHGVGMDGSTAKITTGSSTATYNHCSEEEKPKVQKLCLYDSKKGYDYKRNIKIKLPFGAKNTPKSITGTYYVNGEAVNFKLIKCN